MLSGSDYSDNRIYQSGWEQSTGQKKIDNILRENRTFHNKMFYQNETKLMYNYGVSKKYRNIQFELKCKYKRLFYKFKRLSVQFSSRTVCHCLLLDVVLDPRYRREREHHPYKGR